MAKKKVQPKKPRITKSQMEDYIHENGTGQMVDSIEQDNSLGWVKTVYDHLKNKEED